MKNTAADWFVRAVSALPLGATSGHFIGRTYVASKTVFNNGRSFKLVAEETGGSDYVSLNLYMLKNGARVFPCEMSHAKVFAFVEGFKPH